MRMLLHSFLFFSIHLKTNTNITGVIQTPFLLKFIKQKAKMEVKPIAKRIHQFYRWKNPRYISM